MFIALEVAALFFLLYAGLLFWVWREHTNTLRFLDDLLIQMEELRGLNMDLKTHNEILQTRYNLMVGSKGSVLNDDTMILHEDKTMPSFTRESDEITLDSLAEEITAIKKLLDQKLSMF